MLRWLVVLLASALAAACSGLDGPGNGSLNATEVAETLIAQAVNATLAARSVSPTRTLPSPLIAPSATRVPTMTPVPTLTSTTTSPTPDVPSPTAIGSPALTPFPGPTATPSVTLTPTPRPTSTLCPNCPTRPHFWMERPIGAGHVDYVDPTYRYGETQNGAREPHHGVEFQNPEGTPVLAVADGTVVVAGNDWKEVYGRELYFYGTLVVLQLNDAYLGQPVFALYGHLTDTSVHVGQTVTAGALLGHVGASGVALGPHLHFEVRVGRNDYRATRNPELWLQPLSYNGTGWGAMAGQVQDKDGKALHGLSVVIRSLSIRYDEPITKYAVTYASDAPALNGDDELHENFAMGDLPPGTYEVAVNTTTLYRQTIVVAPGQVSFVRFNVNPLPPTPTATP